MTHEEARTKAEEFLRSVSNDESWIDASSEFAKSKLTALLMSVAEAHHREEKMRESCASLGYVPGSFDE